MLKRNWNWRNNSLFCHIFVIDEISIGEGSGPPASPWLRQWPNWEKQKGVRKFSARFLVFYNKISTVQKIVLSSSRGQGNFRGPKASRPRPRTWGFEAKAKDLKMCPRGQGRPRGLELWFLQRVLCWETLVEGWLFKCPKTPIPKYLQVIGTGYPFTDMVQAVGLSSKWSRVNGLSVCSMLAFWHSAFEQKHTVNSG